MEFQFAGFAPEARQFLRDLKRNNDREWFKARKADYERHVRGPMLRLVGELGISIAEHSPGYMRDARKSVYRIYRDIRFSKDKSPYKTPAAAVFPPNGLARHEGAGFYFQFSSDELLVGGGVYAPSSASLRKIREQVASDPRELRAILADRGFAGSFGSLDGATLKRVPRGFARDHSAADLLVYKQFLAGVELPAAEIEKPTIGSLLDRHFRLLAPLLEYLNRPLRAA